MSFYVHGFIFETVSKCLCDEKNASFKFVFNDVCIRRTVRLSKRKTAKGFGTGGVMIFFLLVGGGDLFRRRNFIPVGRIIRFVIPVVANNNSKSRGIFLSDSIGENEKKKNESCKIVEI